MTVADGCFVAGVADGVPDGVPEAVADGCVVTGEGDGGADGVAVAADAVLAASIMAHHSQSPSIILNKVWEDYSFAGRQIRIKESTDLYGAVLWPSV